jgi:hypothetical protein
VMHWYQAALIICAVLTVLGFVAILLLVSSNTFGTLYIVASGTMMVAGPTGAGLLMWGGPHREVDS